jgi:hypothetical protein
MTIRYGKQQPETSEMTQQPNASRMSYSLTSLFLKRENGQDMIVPAHTAGQLLKEHTHLRHMHSFPDTGCCYLYDKTCGHYIKLSEAQVRVLIYHR